MPAMVRPKGKPTDIALDILGKSKKKKTNHKKEEKMDLAFPKG